MSAPVNRRSIAMRGGKLHAHVYGQLAGTAREIAERLNLRLEPVEVTLRSFKSLGLCHRSAIVHSPGERQVPTGYYSRGPGVNVPYPRAGLVNSRPLPGAIAFASLLKALASGVSIVQAYEETGNSKFYCRTVIAILREYGLAYRSGWGGYHSGAAEFTLGEGEDVRRPKPKPKVVINRDFWARRRAKINHQAIEQCFRYA